MGARSRVALGAVVGSAVAVLAGLACVPLERRVSRPIRLEDLTKPKVAIVLLGFFNNESLEGFSPE